VSSDYLASHLCDLARSAFRSGVPRFSDFLSPAERSLALSLPDIRHDCSLEFRGGYEGAERTMAAFLPFGYGAHWRAPLTALAVHVSVGCRVGHRDILGALMALGVKRQTIGDILVPPEGEDAQPLLFCTDAIAPYLIDNLTRAGRYGIRLAAAGASDLPVPKTESKTFTVMSPRLDAVLSDTFGIPRASAAEMVRKGLCFLNWKECLSPDRKVAEGDTVSLRGHGRMAVSSVGGLSRKGRTYMTVEMSR